MKKVITILAILILTAGCSSKEKKFEKYAKDYYENYLKHFGFSQVIITLDDLRNAGENSGYNLKSLKKCDGSSKAIFYIDIETEKVKNQEIELNC